MRPIYNSVRINNHNHQRDIKSVERDPIYAQLINTNNSTNRAQYAKPNLTINEIMSSLPGPPPPLPPPPPPPPSSQAQQSTRPQVIMGLGAHTKMFSSVSAAASAQSRHRQSLLNVPFMESGPMVRRDIRSCEREVMPNISTMISVTPNASKAPQPQVQQLPVKSSSKSGITSLTVPTTANTISNTSEIISNAVNNTNLALGLLTLCFIRKLFVRSILLNFDNKPLFPYLVIYLKKQKYYITNQI